MHLVAPPPVTDGEIVALSQRFANKYQRTARLTPEETEDLIQSLALHLVEKLSKYRPERGPFNRFASVLLRNKAISYFRARKAQCRNARGVVSLNQEVKLGKNEVVELSASLPEVQLKRRLGGSALDNSEHWSLSSDIYAVGDQLTGRQRMVGAALMRGTVTQAAKELGLSRDTVYEEMRVIRERYEDAGLAKYLENKSDTL